MLDVNGTAEKPCKALFFDSGVGGLSIREECIKAMPWLDASYVFDHGLFPYGEQPEDVVVKRVLAIVSKTVSLIGADIAVIACNTASTVALPALRASLDIPVVGVVPAIKPAAAKSRSKKIGLLATPATIRRKYTDELIENFAKGCEVIRVGSSELVRLAEEKIKTGCCSQEEIRNCLLPFFDDNAAGMDELVLGCTHFPLLKAEISACLPGIECIDSGAAVAMRIEDVLKDCGFAAPEPLGEKPAPMAFAVGEQPSIDSYSRCFSSLGFSEFRLLAMD